MAVVVSQGQNEIADLKAKGLDILPHRERMQKEDLETKFKNPADPLRLVFVCAMWITGFDVPTIGTVYLDKPMKNHTLMQTIARANRRAEGKTSGVIVDYVGVFQNLQKALAIYAGSGGGESPIKDKEALVAALETVLGEARCFIEPFGVDVASIMAEKGFSRHAKLQAAAEALIAPDERRREYLRLAGAVARAYKAILPDERAAPYLTPVAVLHTLAEIIRAKLPPVDIAAISEKIAALLDDKIEGVAILQPIAPERGVDLSGIDFEKLAKLFEKAPRTAAETLKEGAEKKVKEMAERNPTRQNLVEKLEALVARYNAGGMEAEEFFDALKAFVDELGDEERRAVREELTEDELAIFDLLTKPEPRLTKAQEIQVKSVARRLLERLQELLQAIDWTASQQIRGAVFSEIRQRLNELPEEPYPRDIWSTKVDEVWQFVLRRYGEGAA
jgi:type I restriction enzyme R subunit